MKKLKLENILQEDKNIAKLLDDDSIQVIVDRVIGDYEHDISTRSKLDRINRKALKLAKMDTPVKHDEDTGLPKYDMRDPLIAKALTAFVADVASEIIKRDKVAGFKVNGLDPEGIKSKMAERRSKYRNYKLLHDSPWADNLEQGLAELGLLGTKFRKVYYDPVKGDIVVDNCPWDSVYIDPEAKSVEEARRISSVKKVTVNTLMKFIRSGYFLDLDLEELDITSPDSDNYDNKMQEILEQDCQLDLDGDGISEPYCVYVHLDSRTLLGITALFEEEDVSRRPSDNKIIGIEGQTRYVAYKMLPSFDGGFYGVGYGQLLLSLTEIKNKIQNILIDAGELSTSQTGIFSGDVGLKAKSFNLKRGHILNLPGNTDSAKSLQMINFPEPSSVLFQMLGIIDEYARDISSTTNIMNGNQLAQNAPATTTVSLIERGRKVYSFIHKVILRSLTRELKLIDKLERKYIDYQEYINVLDDPEADPISDFRVEGLEIVSTADPEISSDTQRMAQSEALLQLLQHPKTNDYEIIAEHLRAMKINNPERYLVPPDQEQPDPKMVETQMKGQSDQQKLELEHRKQELKEQEHQLKVIMAQMKQIADDRKAEQEETKLKLEEMKILYDTLSKDRKSDVDLEKAKMASKEKENSSDGQN